MLEYLNEIDSAALLAINGTYTAFQDFFWWMTSALWSSTLFVLALIWVLMHKNRRYALLVFAMLVLAFLIADQVSAGLIKNLVGRLRPTRDPSLGPLVHIVNGYRGGMYGFVSSHAANSFAASVFISLVMRRRLVTLVMITWACLQCYGRMYLGVHYPGDILGGTVLGILTGWAVYRLMLWVQRRYRIPNGYFTATDAAVMASAFTITVMSFLLIALYQAL